MEYIERLVLQQQPKEDLIKKIIELQERDKKWVDMYSQMRQSKKESDKKHEETLKVYKERHEELVKLNAQTQVVTEEYKHLVDLKLGNTFNVNATWVDKIVFILKDAGRPLSSSEIIEFLLKNDVTFRTLTNHPKGLSAHLTKVLKYGRIVGEKQKGQNGYLFCLPNSPE